MYQKISEEQANEICRRYLAGENAPELGVAYQVSRGAIEFWLEKRGIPRRQNGLRLANLSIGQLQDICAQYEAGQSVVHLAKAWKTTFNTIIKIINIHGDGIHPASISHRRYAANLYFFSEIATELQSYWLGFIAADGGISKQELKIVLAKKDWRHLLKFKRALQSKHPIRFEVRKSPTGKLLPYARFTVHSPQICNDLFRYGVTPRKSLTIQWPPIPPTLDRHFLRGYFDGDGSVYHTQQYKGLYPNASPLYHWSLVGNPQFLVQAQQILATACQLNFLPLRRRNNTAVIREMRYTGNVQVARIAHYLYDEATIYLPRKYQRMLPLLGR